MPDSPDFQKYLPNSSRFSLQDMGELAVRVGLPNVYDRRGEMIFWDTFDYGFGGWTITNVGTGAAHVITSDERLIRPYTLKVTNGTSGNRSFQMGRYLALLSPTKIGHEISFKMGNSYDTLVLAVVNYDGVNATEYWIRLNTSANTLSYINSSGGFTTLDDINDKIVWGFTFNYLKVVVDTQTRKYHRLMINNNEYDMSAIPGFPHPDATAPSVRILLSITGQSGFNTITYLAHDIVTANEP